MDLMGLRAHVSGLMGLWGHLSGIRQFSKSKCSACSIASFASSLCQDMTKHTSAGHFRSLLGIGYVTMGWISFLGVPKGSLETIVEVLGAHGKTFGASGGS